jgi:hypothetical protein
VNQPTAPDPLLKGVSRALRPLVRLLLAKGIAYPQLMELLKGLYVEHAERDFPVAGKAQTDSRISLLTGIHRKDVKRLRALPDGDSRMPENVSLGMRLINAWESPPFADIDGQPKRLPRLARQGGELSFEGLVESVSKDIRARAVLDEWVRLGVARVDADDAVVLVADAFVPHQGFAEKAYYFGHNLHDHAAAAANNLLGEKQPFLERSVHYDGVPAGLVAHLAQDAKTGGMRLLKSLNRKAQEAAPADKQTPRRFTCGVYFYAEDADSPPRDVAVLGPQPQDKREGSR